MTTETKSLPESLNVEESATVSESEVAVEEVVSEETLTEEVLEEQQKAIPEETIVAAADPDTAIKVPDATSEEPEILQGQKQEENPAEFEEEVLQESFAPVQASSTVNDPSVNVTEEQIASGPSASLASYIVKDFPRYSNPVSTPAPVPPAQVQIPTPDQSHTPEPKDPSLYAYHPTHAVTLNTSEERLFSFPMGSRLFIGRLATERVTREELAQIFVKYGPIHEVSLKNSFGFVQFETPEACQQAVLHEQGRQLGGLSLGMYFKVNWLFRFECVQG